MLPFNRGGVDMRWRRMVFVGVLTWLAVPAAGHHSMSALFDFNQRLTQTGVLTQVDWTNPHIYLYVTVEGEMAGSWAFEGPSPIHFRRRGGVDKEDFHGGDRCNGARGGKSCA